MLSLKEHYSGTVINELKQTLKLSTGMAVPKITKVTINMGVGEVITDKKVLEKAVEDGYDLPEAQRIAEYQIITKAELQEKVGRNRLGGILDFDVADQDELKKRMPKLRDKTGQFFFDPYDGKIKELVNEGGKLFFREFNSVAEITFAPDDAPTVVDEKFMGEPAFPPEYIE